jgi:hypothetical protein
LLRGKGRNSGLIVKGDTTYYYSLNNRRLWVYKQLREKNFLKNNKIFVRAKAVPTSKRLQNKFDPKRCALSASFLKPKPGTGKKEGTEHGEDNEENEEDMDDLETSE